MTADSADRGPSLSRRRLIKGAGAAGGVAATGGAALSVSDGPVGRAEAIPPLLLAAGAGAALVGAAAAGYMTRGVVDNVTGDEATVPSEYSNAAKQDALAEIETRADSIHAANDQVFTVMENRLNDSKNIAWARGKAQYIEDRAASKGHSTANSNAVGEVESFYSTIQTNLLNHVQEVGVKCVDLVDTARTAGWSDPGAFNQATPFRSRRSDGSSMVGVNYDGTSFGINTNTRTLLDGSSYNEEYAAATDSGTDFVDFSATEHNGADGTNGADNILEVERASDNTFATVFNANRAQDLWDTITSLNSTMTSDIQSWADSLDSNKSQSEIAALPTDDPSLIASEYSSDEGHYGYAGADLAALGLSTNHSSSSLIHLHFAQVTVEGQIYLTTDKSLNVGQKYDPATITGAVYLAYDNEDSNGSTSTATPTPSSTSTTTPSSTSTSIVPDGGPSAGLVRLEQEFTILEAKSFDGSDTDSISYSSPNDQTSDVSLTQEQMKEIQDLRQELKDAKERAAFGDGGGGGIDFSALSIGGLSGSIVALIAAAAGLLYFGDSSQ